MAHVETKHRRDGVLEIFEDLCGSALGENRNLGITKEEASGLLNSLIKRDELMEKLKKIEINRRPYKVEYFSKFKKYFETMGHNGVIERICFDNSCRFAFSGGADGIIKCWSIPDGMLVKSLYGHENMISDLCINKEGSLLVSVDYRGLLNVWCLGDFSQLHSVSLNSEAIFCEFVEHCGPRDADDAHSGNISGNADSHKIFIVLADGTVKSLTFNYKEIIEEEKNTFMEGESIKSICITDGGRLVICGGWWPFFLVYDTQDLNNVIVLEDFKIQTLCAAKNALKFAASSENQIFSYTFYCEGPVSAGNFIKKRAGCDNGYWRRHVNLIDGDYIVEWLSFLPSFLLVAACSDNIIRIYEDDQLILSFKGEAGTIYSHPAENIFAVVGTKLSIYQLNMGREYPETSSECENIWHHKGVQYFRCTSNDRPSYIVTNARMEDIGVSLIYSEDIFIGLNDCQFSDDGRFLVTCDDQGIIKAYSIDESITVPEQQFFMSDLERQTQAANAGQAIDRNVDLTGPGASGGLSTVDETVNFYKQKNAGWFKIPYVSSSSAHKNRCIQIENLAILTLDKLKLNENRFKRRYLARLYENQVEESQVEEANEHDESEESDDETCIMSESNDAEESSGECSDGPTSESVLTASEESSTSHVRLRRSPVSSSSSSSMKRQRIRKLRGFRRTDASPNRRLIESESNSNANRNMRRTRRFIIEDSDKSGSESGVVDDADYLNGNSLDTATTGINSSRVGNATSAVGMQRVLRRSLGLLPGSEHNSDLAMSMEEPRRVLRRNIEKKQNMNGEGKESADSAECIGRKPGIPARLSVDEECSASADGSSGDDVCESNKGVKRPKRGKSSSDVARSMDSEAILSLADSVEEDGIDPDFEILLANFAYDWLSVCSVYTQTQVYFNSSAYEEFMDLEPRISYSKSYPRESGMYTVTSRQYKFIGKIPYLVLGLDSMYTVKIYEYPHSKGVVCTADQYNIRKGVNVLYCRNSEYLKGTVSKASRMTATVNKNEVLKSMLAISYSPLDIPNIPYSSSLKALFGLSRVHKFMQKPVLSYSLVNFKLSNDLYKSQEEFADDLRYLSNLASKMGEPLKSQAKAVYRRYTE